MKMKIEIEKIGKGYLRGNEKLAEIEINNGHWKVWENHMECTEDDKVSLTINNLHDMMVLNLPCKDAIGIHDKKVWEEHREFKIKSAIVRNYDNLVSYLN